MRITRGVFRPVERRAFLLVEHGSRQDFAMRGFLCAVVLVTAGSLSAFGATFADAAYLPPATSKEALDTQLHPMRQTQVESYLDYVDRSHVFDEFAGRNGFLKSTSGPSKAYIVADGFATALDSNALFGDGFVDGEYAVYEALIASVDATALRFLVDLSNLGDGDEVWVIDLNGPRAFGPYTRGDAIGGGRWLPTTEGEAAVLMLRTANDTTPEITLEAVSHFFEDLGALLKVLSCNNNVACDGNPTVQSVRTGVGMMVIPQGQFFQALCTGSLINNPDTAELEPYLLTSWHCVPDSAGASQVDMIWDYRAASCVGDDHPAISSLPRSTGERVLTTNSSLDLTLMELVDVPAGAEGRTYLGWETRAPNVNENIVTIHHPQGSHQRISYGDVEAINQSSAGFTRLTKVHWDDGVTEGGSSGSPLLLTASNYRITGTLSNGPVHSCTNTAGNVDWYTSFRDFFAQARPYLSDSPGTGGSATTCPANTTFKENPEIIEQLRRFRDEGLLPFSWGKPIVDGYYRAAPYVEPVVGRYPLARGAFRLVAIPFARLGAWLGG
jgi:hypothetical protein